MKMSDLVEADFKLLSVLQRMGIDDSFGEKTVGDICVSNGLDTATFLLVCNVYSNPDFIPGEDILRHGHVSDILRYLHQSHDWYLNNALVSLASAIERLIKPCPAPQQKVIWKFFSDYKAELENHFGLEEDEVIPYIQNLLIGRRTPGYSIDTFEQAHSNVDEKISDLKNLIMKALPPECDPVLRISLLNFLFNLQADLYRHTCVEEKVMVPMVRLIEDPHRGCPRPQRITEDPDDGREELSNREKEILVSVAKGMTNKEIADAHHISVNTVITHRKNITRKTGIKTVAGLTVYAILNNLIDINSVE